jgi:DNA polymerase-3 subunit epsilon
MDPAVDFENIGRSPAMGDRATEISAVMIRDRRIVDQYQSLMNAGRCIPLIEHLTWISSAMIPEAAPASRVLAGRADLVGDWLRATPS